MTQPEFEAPRLDAVTASFKAIEAQIQSVDEKTLTQQRDIAQVPAPTGKENRRALLVAGALQQMGYLISRDSAGNVIASLGRSPTSTPVVCMAHLDTVFDEQTKLAPVERGTRISCPGIGDNGRGLAVMLALAKVLGAGRDSAHTRPIEFVASVGEEGLGNLLGARTYFADRRRRGDADPHAVVAIDGPGDQQIVHHALGSLRYHIVFNGVGGHSWVDFGTPNAVHAAARAVAMLSEIPRGLRNQISLTVSGIGGGESMNSIPSFAWIDVDLRGTAASRLSNADRELRRLVALALEMELHNASRTGFTAAECQAAGARPPIECQIEVVGERPAGSLSSTHPLVQLAERITTMQGVSPVSAIASTDANIPLSMGIPAITIGGGGTGGASHTIDEWYDNTDGPRGIMRAYAILAALAA